MNTIYVDSQDFHGSDFGEKPLAPGDYESCTFTNCLLSNVDLARMNFIACEFDGCDLSMAKINGTAFREVKFKKCKMLGLHFEHTNDFLFSVAFDECQLDLSSFYNRSLKNTNFKGCSLRETDFGGADLTNAIFHNCDLQGAIFENTVLEKADLRSSFSFMIDPEMNRIKKARFSLTGIAGLLGKYDIEIE